MLGMGHLSVFAACPGRFSSDLQDLPTPFSLALTQGWRDHRLRNLTFSFVLDFSALLHYLRFKSVFPYTLRLSWTAILSERNVIQFSASESLEIVSFPSFLALVFFALAILDISRPLHSEDV
ncbi:hypothetical protein Tco_0434634 [Tanacetum coccineum]